MISALTERSLTCWEMFWKCHTNTRTQRTDVFTICLTATLSHTELEFVIYSWNCSLIVIIRARYWEQFMVKFLWWNAKLLGTLKKYNIQLMHPRCCEWREFSSHETVNLKVAVHSFSARSCWCNLARAQGFQKTNMPSTERSFYLPKTRTICVISLYNCMQCIDGFSILLQRYVIKGNDAKNPAIFSFCLLPKELS